MIDIKVKTIPMGKNRGLGVSVIVMDGEPVSAIGLGQVKTEDDAYRMDILTVNVIRGMKTMLQALGHEVGTPDPMFGAIARRLIHEIEQG